MTAPHKTVAVDLGPRSYDIKIGPGLIARAGVEIAPLAKRRTLFVLTDAHVAERHLPRLESSLREAGLQVQSLILPPGEATKDFAHLAQALDALESAHIERGDLLVALGGGVIGDLGGFSAAIHLRGIDFVQIPTTLLSQVDSSVGGKTGINTPRGKNLVGAFHQPRLVLADTDTLATLPLREMRAGYAEVVKYGLIDDLDFFAWLEKNGQRVLDRDVESLIHAVAVSCAAKARTVAADEREAGNRALLNLGHTFGHALEAECGYGGDVLHGEAVAIGMVLAFDLSVRLGLCPPTDLSRMRKHLQAMGLQVSPKDIPGRRFDAETLLAHMRHDKKASGGKITFVLARGVGQSFLARDVAEDKVRAMLTDAVA